MERTCWKRGIKVVVKLSDMNESADQNSPDYNIL